MALNTNVVATSGLTPANLDIYYDKQFLDNLKPDLFFDQFAQKKSLPKGSGKSVTFTRYTPFAANVAALTDGTVPSGKALASATINAVPLQYGDYISMSDMLMLESIDPIVESAQELLASCAALSLDTIIRNTLHSAVTTQCANAAANEGVTAANITAAELRKAVRTLKNAKAKAFPGQVMKGIFSPMQTFDLLGESNAGGFLDVTKYTSADPAAKGLIGKLWGVEVFESQNIQEGTGSGSAKTYRAYIFGQGAYGIIDIEGMGLKTYRKQLGSGGTSDPIDQISTVGHKFSHVTKVLDANRAIELITLASA